MGQTDHNVVSFSKKSPGEASGAEPRSQVQKLYQECETLAVKALQAIVRQMFEKADDTLFSMAEKADKTVDQTQYFDSMRIVRMKRASIEGQFLEQVKQNFLSARFSKKTGETDVAGISLDGIALVDDSDLEEEIAIKNMVAKILNHYSEDIGAIEQRFAVLLPSANLDAQSNPLGANRLCRAFMRAIGALNVGLKINLIILKLFELHIVHGLRGLYDNVNQHLIEAGVLPKIKHHIAPGPAGSGYTAPPSPLDALATSGASGVGGFADPSAVSLGQLQTLLSQYRQRGQAGGYGVPAGAAVMSTGMPGAAASAPLGGTGYTGAPTLTASTDLAAVLSSIQISALAGQGDAIDTAVMVQPAELKNYVLTQLQSQGHNPQHLHPLDNDVIDIVAMLFEYILNDESIPDTARALLGKLQIPMLKAAVLDKAFFSAQGHPARALLNEMGKAVLAMPAQATTDNNALLAEIKRIVDQVLSEFKDDIAIFVSLLDEFKQFVVQHSQAETQVQVKLAERIREKEDYALARQWVEASLQEVLQQRPLPEPIHVLIEGPWKEVMLKTYLNAGQDSATWKNQIRFIEILDWSIQPKRASLDRSKLAAVIYHLVNTLRNGLQTIGLPADEIQQVMAQLEPYHLASIKGQRYQHSDTSQPDNIALSIDTNLAEPTNPLVGDEMSFDDIRGAIYQIERDIAAWSDEEAVSSEPQAATSDNANDSDADVDNGFDKMIMEDIVLSDYQTEQYDPAAQPQDEYLQLARHLEQGKWVEFTDKNKHKIRAKLAFKSELLGEYTFLDWKFNVVADKTLYGLAADLRRGTATIINDVPIMDRALNAVMNMLGKSSAK